MKKVAERKASGKGQIHILLVGPATQELTSWRGVCTFGDRFGGTHTRDRQEACTDVVKVNKLVCV